MWMNVKKKQKERVAIWAAGISLPFLLVAGAFGVVGTTSLSSRAPVAGGEPPVVLSAGPESPAGRALLLPPAPDDTLATENSTRLEGPTAGVSGPQPGSGAPSGGRAGAACMPRTAPPVYLRPSVSERPIATTGGGMPTVRTTPGGPMVGVGAWAGFGTPSRDEGAAPERADQTGMGQTATVAQQGPPPEGEVPDDDSGMSAPRPSALSPQSDGADSAGGADTSEPVLDPIDANFTPSDDATPNPLIDVPSPATLILLATGLFLLISRAVVTRAPRAVAGSDRRGGRV